MISRPDARNSIIKLDLCAPFCSRFLMLPAASGPQIVKLELGGQNSFHGRSRSRGASNRKVGIGALSWVHAALFKLGF